MEFDKIQPKEFINSINEKETRFTTNSTEMGLRRRSISMPKLFTKWKADNYELTSNGKMASSSMVDCHERSQIIQVFSGKESSREIGMRIIKFTTNKQPELQGPLDSRTSQNKKNKGLHAAYKQSSRVGFSDRLRGMFISLFHLDRRFDVSTSRSFNSEFNSSLPTEAIRYSKSLPDLNHKVKPTSKQLSFRRQRSYLFSWLRKSKKRSNRNRIERQDSYSSMNPSSSCESSPDMSWNSRGRMLKRGAKSLDIPASQKLFTTNNDNSASSSPSSFAEISGSNNRVYFDKSPENSPEIMRQTPNQAFHKDMMDSPKSDKFTATKLDDNIDGTSSILNNSLKSGSTFLRRQLPRSLSESSWNPHLGGQEDLNNSMISNASLAAQRKRRIFATRKTKSVDKDDQVNCNYRDIFKEGAVKNNQNLKKNFAEKQNEIIYNIIQRELTKNLQGKEFHPQKSRLWCTEISESIKSKIEIITGGVYKIIVQVFIGAVEDEGIMTATQCSLGPRTDNFTVASFRHDSLFAFASVLAIDFREISVPVKKFQNLLFSKVHSSSSDNKNNETEDVRSL